MQNLNADITAEDFKAAIPNGYFFRDSMSNLPYLPEEALADIVDGAIDAKATEVNLEITRVYRGANLPALITSIVIEDNGHGMSLDELTQYAVMGKGSKRSNKDLGRFNTGYKSASSSLSRTTSTLSKKTGSPVSKAVIDLNRANDGQGYPVAVKAATKEVSDEFIERVGMHGTIFVLNDLMPKIAEKDFDMFAQQIKKHFGLIYRNFIAKGIKFTLNDEEIKAIDPFENATLRLDHAFKFGGSSRVRMKLFWLDKDNGLVRSMLNQGFYLMRNGRQIGVIREQMAGYVPHPSTNGFRAEIEYGGDADNIFSTDITKTFFNLSAPEAKEIWETAYPYRKKPVVVFSPPLTAPGIICPTPTTIQQPIARLSKKECRQMRAHANLIAQMAYPNMQLETAGTEKHSLLNEILLRSDSLSKAIKEFEKKI